MHVTILGAGVVGLTTATELVERGCKVDLVDLAAQPGPHACSWHAGGMLAPWCEGEIAEQPVVRLGCEALDWWDQRVHGVVKQGTLVVAANRDTAELRRFSRRTEHHELLDAQAIGMLEPALDGRFHKAMHFPHEGHLDPRLALHVLVQKLAERGVNIRRAARDAAPGFKGTIIDARGFSARDTLADLRGVKGEMIVLRSDDISLSRPVRLLHPRFPAYVVPRGDGLFMMGATQVESEDRSRITARGMCDLINAAYSINPAFAEAEIVETGCDIRPAFPDNLPRIVRLDGRFFINGLYRHGFLLAPGLARLMADFLLAPHTINDADRVFLTEAQHENTPQRANA